MKTKPKLPLTATEKEYMIRLLESDLDSLRDVLETEQQGIEGLQAEVKMVRTLIAKLLA